MRLITRDTDYAIMALCCMATQKKGFLRVKELESRLGIPRPFLRKILQRLSKKCLVKSFKGKAGGFLLNKPLDKIYVLEVMKIFQGPLEINKCLFKNKTCPRVKTCLLKKKIERIEDFVRLELGRLRLSSLLKKGKGF